jgi:hypothetical protein
MPATSINPVTPQLIHFLDNSSFSFGIGRMFFPLENRLNSNLKQGKGALTQTMFAGGPLDVFKD